MKIYFAGAHSTGKTTLANIISKEYELPLLTECARDVMRRMKVTLKDLRKDIGLTTTFQEKVAELQVKKEKRLKDNFVSDRSLDFLAYTSLHSVNACSQARRYASYIGSLNSLDSVVFFIRPCQELFEEDGEREKPTLKSVYQVDAALKAIFELNDINYISIDSPSMSDRVRTVRSVLKFFY